MTDEQLFIHLKKVGIRNAKMITAKESLVIDKNGNGYSLLPSFFERYKLAYSPKSGKYKVKKIGMIS